MKLKVTPKRYSYPKTNAIIHYCLCRYAVCANARSIVKVLNSNLSPDKIMKLEELSSMVEIPFLFSIYRILMF